MQIGSVSRQALTVSRPAARPVESAPVAGDTVEIGAPAQEQPVELVRVGHQRELRGAWISSVWNINFPSAPTLNVEQQKAELRNMVDRLADCGFNALFFQVRPEGDALYKSDLEPWSNSLTGTQGKDPGYDPLEYLIGEAHEKGLEVHAWFNPYRAKAASATQVSPHLAADHPEVVHRYGSYKWMDPGASVVRERLVDVCRDVTKRYDVDGIHFDDYFYPYPIAGTPFPDNATYGAYQAGGGKMSRADWRRENVNRAIRDVHDAVMEEKDYVRFGVSPFGMPAPDKPEGTSGFDQYNEMYADTQKWMDEGWVDYLAPQLYWPTVQPKQPYEKLLNWWADHAKGGRHIFAGNNIDALGSNSKWTVAEFRKEVEISRKKYAEGSQGNIWWNVGAIMQDKQGIQKVFKDEFYARPALTPAVSTAAGKAVAHPSVQQEGGKVRLQHQDAAPLRAWTVYKQEGDQWKLDRILPGDRNEVELPAGKWAIAAATKHGAESQGVTVTV